MRRSGDVAILKEREQPVYRNLPGETSYFNRLVLVNCSTGQVQEQQADTPLGYRRLGKNRWISGRSDVVFSDKGRSTSYDPGPNVSPQFAQILRNSAKGLWEARAKVLNARWSFACPEQEPINSI